MSSLLLFGLCSTFLSMAADGLPSADHLMMVALPGQRITLPCRSPSVKSCSSVNWTMEDQFTNWVSEVVTAGRVMSSTGGRYSLLPNCSLEITRVAQGDARRYACNSGTLNSSVSLRILEIRELALAEDTLELQCILNTFKGYFPCTNSTGVHIKWTARDDTPLNGERFRTESQSACFSKLIISKERTDHHRTWRCHLMQGDEVRASIGYRTAVKGGLEEVFAAADESVSLACGNTSPLSFGDSIKWTVKQETPTSTTTSEHGLAKGFHVSEDSSLVISKLSPQQAGDYQCAESSGQRKVFNQVRLHTLDVTARRENLSLTCVLTCAEECEEDFSLTWSAANEEGWRSRSMKVNNTLINVLLLPAWPKDSEELSCSVYREGSLMASKKWHSDASLQKLAWLGLLGLLGLLMCAAAGGLYLYVKRKQNKDAANTQSSIAMVEEVEEQRPLKGEVPTTDDGLYNLLQAVN
ncbi:uncharacterized protein LOC108241974 isoform X2 [Kryptolebias marmoratus]|uniref:uncharacterized protein LOC108241974 isoform X2 n=1 Tax=Kryptolebias marmoratus TaxID=37003 RepID=UPI0018AC9125|nr:uncharacterized protein LOC108241974 isoform X2 [Kryptolebias marmoratus]